MQDPQRRHGAANRRAADRKHERQSTEAILCLSLDVAELAELRGRVSLARAILTTGGDRQKAIDALDGRPIEPFPQAEEG